MKHNKKWTKDEPTISGWYWAIEKLYNSSGDSYVIEIVQVIINSSEKYCLSTEHLGRDPLHYYDYWLGPLKHPDKLPWNK